VKKWLCILFALNATAAHAAANDYAYAWTIVPDVGGPAYQVELTPEVYAALTTSDLRDFDVVNNAGESVPTAIYRQAAAAPRNPTFPLPMFTVPAAESETTAAGDDAIHLHVERGPDGRLRSLDAATTAPMPMPISGTGGARNPGGDAARPLPQLDNRSKIILDASRLHAPLLSLRIDWNAATDATAHFGISASEDLQNWRSIVGNAAATRLTQDGNTLERHEIPLDRAPHTYLMLTRFDNGPALPNLQVSVTTPAGAQQPEQRWIAATSDGVDSSDTNGTTFLYHLLAPLAATGTNLQLADDNTVARAQLIYAPSADPKARLALASIVAFRLRDGDTLLSNDPMRNVAAQRAREWRVSFATPVTHAPALEIGYTPDRIVFLAQGGQPYRLLAGSAKAHHADAPIDVALAQWRSSNGPDWKPPLVALGARTDAGGESALIPPKPVVVPPWRTWLLWGVLVAAAAIVGGLALSLLRKQG
jgi:hypothetical protein